MLAPALLAALDDDDDTVAEAAVHALGELDPPVDAAVQAVATVANGHGEVVLRETAVAALGGMGHPGGLEAVLAATTDVATVRRRAVLALAAFEGLYAEVARMPGLIDDLARQHRIYVAGPFMLPVMLKNIQLGYVQYRLSKNAEGVQRLLSATKGEMEKMDTVLTALGRNVGTVTSTIEKARTRTRAIARTLREVDLLPEAQAAEALRLEATMIEVEQDEAG